MFFFFLSGSFENLFSIQGLLKFVLMNLDASVFIVSDT